MLYITERNSGQSHLPRWSLWKSSCISYKCRWLWVTENPTCHGFSRWWISLLTYVARSLEVGGLVWVHQLRDVRSLSWQFSSSFPHHHKMAASVLDAKCAFTAGRRGIRTASALSSDLPRRAKHSPEAPSVLLPTHEPKLCHMTTPSLTPSDGGKGEVGNRW